MLVQESVIQDSNCFLLDRRNDLQHNHFQIPLPLRYLHHYFLQHISLHSLLLLRLLNQLLPYLAHRHHHSQYLPHIHHLPHVVLHLHPQFRLHLYLQLHCLLNLQICVLHLVHALHFYHCLHLHRDLDPFQIIL